MSVKNAPAISPDTISALQADSAELRAAILALAQNSAELQSAVKVALAPKTRTVRVKADDTPISEIEGLCRKAGFRVGSDRRKLFVALYERGPGEYPLSDFPGVGSDDANVVARRLDRKAMPYVLTIDNEERANAVLLFSFRKEAE
jgi:hypothetical protein